MDLFTRASELTVISTPLPVATSGRLQRTLLSKTALLAAPVHSTPSMRVSLWGGNPLYKNREPLKGQHTDCRTMLESTRGAWPSSLNERVLRTSLP
jgi:hypothetical protein